MFKSNIQAAIYWQLQAAKKDEGFMTLEIIVALIVGLAFFAFSLQAFGFSVAMKAQSIEKQRANELIQEDIERISQWGSTSLDPINPPPAAGNPPDPVPACNPVDTPVDASTAPVTPARTAYENGYAGALWTALTRNTAANSADLRKNVVNKVNSDGTATTTGGRNLALERFHVSGGGSSTAPHRTLKIGYQVWYWGVDPVSGINDYLNRAGAVRNTTDEPIAETYVEIIPDVALSCP